MAQDAMVCPVCAKTVPMGPESDGYVNHLDEAHPEVVAQYSTPRK